MKFRGGEFSTGTMRNFQPELTEESERIYTRAPPKRVGRAFALLTKTYHGSRVTVHVEFADRHLSE